MLAFGTQEWLDEYVSRINASPEYREAASDWEGELAYRFEAEPDKNWPDDVYAVMDLWHGQCREAFFTDRERAEQAPFFVEAPYTRWKQVIAQELDPIKGMMQGKLRLKGDLPTIVRYVKASNELVSMAAQIPTAFPDESGDSAQGS
jgi:putative sterol carrier protein